MTSRLATLLGLTGLLLTTGCAQTFDATGLGVPATLATAAGEVPAGQAFKVSTHTVHAFWGLLPLRRASLDRALAGQLVGADTLANVRIRTKSRFWDILLTVGTLGILAPRTVTYEGIAVGR